jgi:hypothetical protein
MWGKLHGYIRENREQMFCEQSPKYPKYGKNREKALTFL